MKQQTIICIVGDSGSGKTFASRVLEKRFGIPAIVSYTTRPIREDETDGIEHWFVNRRDVPSHGIMMAYTKFGGYEYWTTISQFEAHLVCTYVIDEVGLRELVSKVDTGLFRLFTVKIKRMDKRGIDKQRIERDKERMEITDRYFDAVIDNDGTLMDFEYKINKLAEKILLWQQIAQ